MKRILLVDDDDDILDINSIYLQREGYTCLTAMNVEQALAIVELENPDLIVLDILLTDGSGMEVCQNIRDRTIAPIIFLTSLLDDRTKIEALQIGGDDYMTKPYKLAELAARIHAQLRRVKMHEAVRYDFPPLEINVSAYRVFLYNQEVFLTQKEMQLLIILVSHQGTVVPTEDLYQRVWGNQTMNETNIKKLHVHISTLRKKLLLDEVPSIQIQTIRNTGYCFMYSGGFSK